MPATPENVAGSFHFLLDIPLEIRYNSAIFLFLYHNGR